MTDLVSKAAFARLKGWNRSTVTRFARDGKIVLTPAGLVDVAASEERLQLARSPRGDGTRARHQHERKAGRTSGLRKGERVDSHDGSWQRLQQSRAQTEAHRAALLRLELDVREGQLVDADAVRRQAEAAGRSFQAAVENLEHRLDALLVAEPDAGRRAELWHRERVAILADLRRMLEVPNAK